MCRGDRPVITTFCALAMGCDPTLALANNWPAELAKSGVQDSHVTGEEADLILEIVKGITNQIAIPSTIQGAAAKSSTPLVFAMGLCR